MWSRSTPRRQGHPRSADKTFPAGSGRLASELEKEHPEPNRVQPQVPHLDSIRSMGIPPAWADWRDVNSLRNLRFELYNRLHETLRVSEHPRHIVRCEITPRLALFNLRPVQQERIDGLLMTAFCGLLMRPVCRVSM